MSNEKLEKINNPLEQSAVLSNTGYKRTYHKSDRVNSSFFEKREDGYNDADSILPVCVAVPKGVDDIEKWLESLVMSAGYRSLEEVMPHLTLPQKEAVVIRYDEDRSKMEKQTTIDIIRNMIILSRCTRTGYNPDSPMIFSYARINRAARLITINLRSFYEMD